MFVRPLYYTGWERFTMFTIVVSVGLAMMSVVKYNDIM